MHDTTNHRPVLELIPELETLPGIFIATRPIEGSAKHGVFILDPNQKALRMVAECPSREWAAILACGLASHVMEAMQPSPGEIMDQIVVALTKPPKKDMN